MICKTCAAAADYLSRGFNHSGGKPSKVIQARARLRHEKCQGCDCQHRVDVLNRLSERPG